MPIVWSERAVLELEEILDYIHQRSRQNAQLVQTRIQKAVELLFTAPQMGRPSRQANVRELLIPQTPYLILYQAEASAIFLISIRRDKRAPAKRPSSGTT